MPVEESLPFAENSVPQPENLNADYAGQSYPSTIPSEPLKELFVESEATEKNIKNSAFESDKENGEISEVSLSSESSNDDSEPETKHIEEEDEPLFIGKPRTKHELNVLPPVESINVEIPPNVPLSEVGKIHALIEDTVVIEACVSGEYQVLDMDSILLLEDRSILGRVFDTFGPVSKPMYSVRFNSPKEIQDLKIDIGQRVFYIPDLASFVYTQPLKAMKGTDASNFYDEEVGEEEQEFSDDEKEEEHRRQLRMKRKGQTDNGHKRSKNQRPKKEHGTPMNYPVMQPPIMMNPIMNPFTYPVAGYTMYPQMNYGYPQMGQPMNTQQQMMNQQLMQNYYSQEMQNYMAQNGWNYRQ